MQSSIDRVRRIFACLANGSIVVISRPDLRQASSSSCGFQFKADANEKLRQEATVFSVMTSIQIGEPGTSACCLLFVKDGKELWVGCGNIVAIIDVDTLEVVHKFRAYVSPRSNVRSMVTDGPTVFTINRKTPDVFQWNVETRQCICKFYIEQENPRGSNLARVVTSKKDNDVSASDDTDDVSRNDVTDDVMGGGDSVIGTTSEVSLDKLLDTAKDPEMYIDVNEHPVGLCNRQPSLMRSLKRDGSRNSSRRKHRVAQDSVPDPTSRRSDSMQKMRSRTQVMSNTDRRITCALIVDGNLWVGRETGDIVVVDISGELGSQEYGLVHAVLTWGTERGHSNKGVHSMLRVGGDKVVSCSRLFRERDPSKERTRTAPAGKQRSFVTLRSPIHQFLRSHPLTTMTPPATEQSEARSEKYQVCVWERWRSDDFREFYKYHESLEKAS